MLKILEVRIIFNNGIFEILLVELQEKCFVQQTKSICLFAGQLEGHYFASYLIEK